MMGGLALELILHVASSILGSLRMVHADAHTKSKIGMLMVVLLDFYILVVGYNPG